MHWRIYHTGESKGTALLTAAYCPGPASDAGAQPTPRAGARGGREAEEDLPGVKGHNVSSGSSREAANHDARLVTQTWQPQEVTT